MSGKQGIPQHCHPNIRLCVDYIRNHSTEPISLETLARLSGWSTYYFSRKFKKDMGFLLLPSVRREKIKYAAHLLKTTEDSIDEILEKISLSSRSHFSEDFTKIMGMPPGAYRKQKKS